MSDEQVLEPPDPAQQFMLRLIPKIGDKIAQYNVDVYERERARVDQLRQVTEESISTEALFDKIANDEEVGEQFRVAVEAARHATFEQKIKLLGRALASGALARDRAVVEASGQLLRLAAELDAPDLRALVAFRDNLEDSSSISTPHKLLLDRGWSEVVAWPVISRLQRLGLLAVEQEASIAFPGDKDDDSVDVLERWTLTVAARELLSMLGDGTNG